jgi:hypothetical protein
MPTREEMMEEVRRKRLMEEVRRKRESEQSGEADEPQPFRPDPTATRIEPKEYTGPVEYGPAAQVATSIPLVGSAAKAGTMRLRALFDREEGEDYDQALARHNKKFASDRDAFERDYPGATEVSSIVGSLALPGVKAASTAGKWIGVPLYNTVESGVDNLLMKDDADEAGLSAAISGSISTGLNLLGAAGKGIATGARWLSGVPKEVGEYYKANADRVNNLDFNKIVNRYMRRQKIANLAEENAGRHLEKVKGAHKQAVLDETDRLRRVRDLEADDTAQNLAQGIIEAKKEIGQRMTRERPDVIRALEEDIDNFEWGRRADDIEDLIRNRKRVHLVDESDPVIQELRDYQMRFRRGEERGAGAESAKAILEDMGQERSKAFGAAVYGKHVGSENIPLMGIRAEMREKLGEKSPEFDRLMKERHILTENRKAVDALGERGEQIQRSFKGLTSKERAAKREALDWLGKETNRDFLSPLKPSEEAREILRKANIGKHMEKLPTVPPVRHAEGVAERTAGEKKIFGGRLREKFSKLANDPTDLETEKGLQQIGDRIGFNASELAKDLRAKNTLTKERLLEPPTVPTGLRSATMQAINRARSRGGPLYKSTVDTFVLSPKAKKARKALDWLHQKTPRTIMAPYNHDYRYEPEEEEL